MTNCIHYLHALYVKQETCLDDRNIPYVKHSPCLDGRENFGGLNVLPCIHQTVGTCEGHALREEDKPQAWTASGKTQKAVIASSQNVFSDNPHQQDKAALADCLRQARERDSELEGDNPSQRSEP